MKTRPAAILLLVGLFIAWLPTVNTRSVSAQEPILTTCGEVYAGGTCKVTVTGITEGLWIITNKEGEPLREPIAEDIPPTEIEFTPINTGKVLVRVIRFAPEPATELRATIVVKEYLDHVVTTCGEVFVGHTCRCNVNRCDEGVWIITNKEGEPLREPIAEDIPPTEIGFTPVETGKVLVRAACLKPGRGIQRATINVKAACSPGWKCKDSTHRAYQEEDCSWRSDEYCECGCEDGECKTPRCSEGWKCKDDWHRAYQNRCDCSWSSQEYCEHGCKDGECVPVPKIRFWVDRDTIVAGECTTLRWDVEHVKAVYLDGEGIAGYNSKQVCPDRTTTYTLRVVTAAGDEHRTVTVNVKQPTATRTPTRKPTPTPTKTPRPTDTPKPPSPTPKAPTPTRIPIKKPTTIFVIDNLAISPSKDRYDEGDPVTIEAEITNSGTIWRSATLIVRWEGAILKGEIGRSDVGLGSGASTREEFRWMIPPEPGTIIAEIEGSTAQISIQAGPVVPHLPYYVFELWPSKDDPKELRVTTPDGLRYEFPVKKVKINVDLPEIPQVYRENEMLDLNLYVPATLPQCLFKVFVSDWLEKPDEKIGTEIFLEILNRTIARKIPLTELILAAEIIECWDEGIAYPIKGGEVTLILEREAHITAKYHAVGPYPYYILRGDDEWSGIVTEQTSSISLKIKLEDNLPIAEIKSISPSPAYEGELVHFSGEGSDPDNDNWFGLVYEWKSSIDGPLSSDPSFSKQLSAGTHTIYFRVRNQQGAWSGWATTTLEVLKHPGKTKVKIIAQDRSGNPVKGAEVYIDGKKLTKWWIFGDYETGKDGVVEFEIDPNIHDIDPKKHYLELKKEGYESYREPLDLSRDQSITYKLTAVTRLEVKLNCYNAGYAGFPDVWAEFSSQPLSEDRHLRRFWEFWKPPLTITYTLKEEVGTAIQAVIVVHTVDYVPESPKTFYIDLKEHREYAIEIKVEYSEEYDKVEITRLK